MSDNKKFELPLDQLKQVGKEIISYAEKSPVQFGLISVAIVGGIVTIVVAPAVGFTAAGPPAGSIAAEWQASIENVAAGSLFATLQSVTMSGTLLAVGGAAIGVGVAGLAGGEEWERAIKWAQGVDWANGGADWGEFSNIIGLAGGEAWQKSQEVAEQIANETCKTTEEVTKGAEEFKEECVKGAEQVGDDMGKGLEQAGNEMTNGVEQSGNEVAKAFQF